MSHDPKGEKAAGIPQNQRERYGTETGPSSRAQPRPSPIIDTATQGVNGGPGNGQASGVGRGMTKGR